MAIRELSSREQPARAAAERLELRNAVHHVEQTLATVAARLVTYIRFSVTADDRREGVLSETFSVPTQTPVPSFWSAARSSGLLASAPPSAAAPASALARTAALALRHATEATREQHARSFLDGFTRRIARDRRRIDTYFSSLNDELDARCRRGRLKPDAIATKRSAIERERAAKLAERSHTRIDTSLVAAVCVSAPMVHFSLEVRRRKGRRIVELEYDTLTQRLIHPACEACHRPTFAPAVCDAALHLICATCIPDAAGRWHCPACTPK